VACGCLGSIHGFAVRGIRGKAGAVNLVHAELPDDAVAAAKGLAGTEFLGGTPLEGERTRLEGYASDGAISELEALGATMTILKSSAEAESDSQELLAMIDEPEPPIA
jgi:hypothetical protein